MLLTNKCSYAIRYPCWFPSVLFGTKCGKFFTGSDSTIRMATLQLYNYNDNPAWWKVTKQLKDTNTDDHPPLYYSYCLAIMKPGNKPKVNLLARWYLSKGQQSYVLPCFSFHIDTWAPVVIPSSYGGSFSLSLADKYVSACYGRGMGGGMPGIPQT